MKNIRLRSLVVYTLKMSVLCGKTEVKIASDGLLEMSEERLRSIMRKEPISTVYHVEQTPFARGKFASVRKIRHLVTGVEYAAKFIRKRRRAADTTREIHHEVAVLALCSGCARVVRLHEVYETPSEVAIVLELCVGGELQRVLEEEERLTEGATRRALRHVLEGLQHLHERHMAHLDLKPQNLLLTDGGEELMICDFGISRAIQPGAHVREILGTIDYVAPEILSYEPLSLAADIWSVGVLAYVLLSGYSPFAGDTKQETFLNIAQCELSFPRKLFRGVSKTAELFIRETLVVDPKGRLTVDECLEHPWLKDESDIPRTIIGVGFQNTAADSDSDSDSDPDYTGNQEYTATEYTKAHNNTHSNGEHRVNGVHTNGKENGVKCNGVNGTHDDKAERVTSESCSADDSDDRDKPLKHSHLRDTSPPFPDAPSTPKVSRKCHDSPSVLSLCKKFQPDYEKPASRAHGSDCACGYECAGRVCCAVRAHRPDRAVLC